MRYNLSRSKKNKLLNVPRPFVSDRIDIDP